MVAAGCTIARRLETVRRGVSRKHGYALHAQGSTIHYVVEVSLHGYQLPFAYGGDHATAAGAKIAGGSELANFGELQLLRLACTAATSTRPPSASPAQPPAAVLNHSLRVTPPRAFVDSAGVIRISRAIPDSLLSFGSKVCSMIYKAKSHASNPARSLTPVTSRNNHFVQRNQRHVICHSVILEKWHCSAL